LSSAKLSRTGLWKVNFRHFVASLCRPLCRILAIFDKVCEKGFDKVAQRRVLQQCWLGAVPLLLAFGTPVFSADSLTLRSHSGQFLVRGLPLGAPLPGTAPAGEVTYVRLDPTLLAISCERIKTAVLEELAMKDQWRGKIYISLHPVRDDQEPIVITSVHYTDGWNYSMEIPEQVNRARLVKSVTEVVLREIANRNGRETPAEMPLWLTEGLATHLQATALANFTLEPETHIARKQRNPDPLARARDCLRVHAPLTLDELTWPSDEPLSEQNMETYQSCAQLFVYELLRLRDGRACLREMLAHLPETLNWQTAFLRAFSTHFQRLIDIDKWWSLHVVHLTGQGRMSAWVQAETCKQLDDILITPVQIRSTPQELPINLHMRLQTIFAEWEWQRQRPVLLQKLNLLAALRRRASQDSVGLVEGYRHALETYLERRNAVRGSARKKDTSPAARLIVSESIKRFDDLDAQREALRNQTNAPAAQFTTTR